MHEQDLRKAGLKVTVPRRKILEIFAQSTARHLTAEDIYRWMVDTQEEIGLATIYRVLTQLEAAGLLVRHHFEGHISVYELNEGPHHDHVVCVECGRVEEFKDEDIEARRDTIARRLAFTIHDHSLVLFGRCAACAQPSSSSPAASDTNDPAGAAPQEPAREVVALSATERSSE